MSVPESVRVYAPAKLNLGLAVLGRRPDDFHDIDTLFARLQLADELILERAEGLTGKLDLRLPPAWAANGLTMDENNLAMRAAASYLGRGGWPGGARIRLVKRIPIAAGLGGGSSDAAAVLLALSRLYPAPIDLQAVAAELGSDVPFFLTEARAARGRRRGERLQPLTLPELSVVLANPGVAVSAGEAYSGIESFTGPLDVAAIRGAIEGGQEPPYRNDLTGPVVVRYPAVADTLDELRRQGLHGVLMSGSGATCFGIAGSPEDAARAAAAISAARPSWWVWAGPAGC